MNIFVRMYNNWLTRHKNTANYTIHMFAFLIGFAAPPVLLVYKHWWWAAGLFVLGYAMQFIGHAIEGNKSGEELLLRRILNK